MVHINWLKRSQQSSELYVRQQAIVFLLWNIKTRICLLKCLPCINNCCQLTLISLMTHISLLLIFSFMVLYINRYRWLLLLLSSMAWKNYTSKSWSLWKLHTNSMILFLLCWYILIFPVSKYCMRHKWLLSYVFLCHYYLFPLVILFQISPFHAVNFSSFSLCFFPFLQTSSDFDAKPMVMLLGQYSTGKTTFIKHLLRTSYPGF